ncbi:MAG: GIY-YIG nuclease family protein [Oscillibacter sp.]
MDWYVYMLRCEDGSLYTGIASDVEKRFAMHKSGHGAKYTRSHSACRGRVPRAMQRQGRGAAARGRHQEAAAREKLELTEENCDA